MTAPAVSAAVSATTGLPANAYWHTTLFDSLPRPAEVVGISARAAFQQALHGYATILDVRDPQARRLGRPAAYLHVVDDPARVDSSRPVLLLADDDEAAASVAGAIPGSVPVLGGFRAWSGARLPVA